MALILHYPLINDFSDTIENNNLHIENENNNDIKLSNYGKIGKCFEKQNKLNNSFLRSKNKILLDNDITLSCWAYVTEVDGRANGIITNHNMHQKAGVSINVKMVSETDYRISCSTGDGTNRTWITYYGITNIKDSWHLLTLTYSKKNKLLKLWVDGKLEKSVPNYNNKAILDYFDVFTWSTVVNSNDYHAKCKLNDVRVYNHELSKKEIQELYKCKVIDISFNNDRYIAQDNCIDGWGGTWDKQTEYFNGHSIFKNIVTKPDSWNNCGFHNKSGFQYNIPLTAKKVYISFWARLIKPYSKNLYGYYKYDKADGTTGSCNWRFNKSWATDSSMTGKWQHIIATADIDSSAGQTSVNCFYVYADKVMYGECDYSNIQISFDNGSLSHINGTNNAEIIINQTEYYPNIYAEPVGPNKNIFEKNILNEWSCNVTGWPDSSGRGKGNFLRISLPEKIHVSECTFSFYANIKKWGYQTSGILAFSENGSDRPSDYSQSFCHQYDGQFQFNFYKDQLYNSSSEKRKYSIRSLDKVIDIGNWHLYTFVCRNNEIAVYRDSKKIQSIAKDISSKYSYYQHIYLGLDNAGGAYRNAYISWTNFQFYNSALSDKDIEELYNSGIYITDRQSVLADSFIEDENNTQFNENKSIETKELIEYSNLLPEEIPTKVLPDGSKWAKIFHHNNKSGKILFSTYDEAKHCGISATDDKFSRLDLLETIDFRNSDYTYEFLLEYPNDAPNKYNRWKQNNNPADDRQYSGKEVPGYIPLHIDMTDYDWGGLCYRGGGYTYLTGSAKSSSRWWFAIGSLRAYEGGVPGGAGICLSVTDLWVRIDNTMTNTIDMLDQASILQNGSISSSDFIEI